MPLGQNQDPMQETLGASLFHVVKLDNLIFEPAMCYESLIVKM